MTTTKRATPTKVTVSERALCQRINRRLKQDGEKLCTARSESTKEQLGEYYVVETGRAVYPKTPMSSGVVYTDVDLVKLGRKLGVLQPWEDLERA